MKNTYYTFSKCSVWPTPTQTLLLRAALGQPDEAVTAWQTWLQTNTLETIDFAGYRLLPLIYRTLQQAAPDDPMLTKLKGIYRHTWYKNKLLFHTITQVLQLLHAAGIKTMILKGAAVLLTCYQDYGLRPMVDFDVLVPTSQRQQAIRVLEQSGWAATQTSYSQSTPIDLNLYHSLGYRNPAGTEFDLHWHLLLDDLRPNADDSFWEGAVPLQVDQITTLTLNPTDHLLHLCLHGLVPLPASTIRWVADAVTLTRAAGDAIDWDRLVTHARRQHTGLLMRQALTYLHQTWNVNVPDAVLTTLHQLPVSQWEERENKIRTQSVHWLAGIPWLWGRYLRLYQLEGGFFKQLTWLPGFLTYLKDRKGFTTVFQLAGWAIPKLMSHVQIAVASARQHKSDHPVIIRTPD